MHKQQTPAASGRLLVGIDAAPPIPMQIGSPEAGDFRGFEVDLLSELAARLRVSLEYRRNVWSVVLKHLAEGGIDLVCSAATVTSERQHDIEFSEAYLSIHLAIVRLRGDRRGKQLIRETVGVRRATTAEAYVRDHGQSISIFVSESNDELYRALTAGDLDCVVDDSPIARHYASQLPDLQFVGSFPNTEASYAIMVRKGNVGLRDQLNQTLREINCTGLLSTLQRNWFGTQGGDLQVG
jgi:ABC-type amino acid transport substrate-binding protein